MRTAPLVLSLLLSPLCLGLAGCGQKGPLFLPSDPPPSQRAPATDSAPAKTAPTGAQSSEKPSAAAPSNSSSTTPYK